MKKNAKLILVSGDPICDHNYYRGNRLTADSPSGRGFSYYQSGGGALLLEKMIEAATSDLSGWKTAFGLNPDYKTLPPNYHSFCLWEPHIINPEEKDNKKQIQVWRADEPLLGYGHPAFHLTTEGGISFRNQAIMPRTNPLDEYPEILVIDDPGLGFRDPLNRHCWPFNSYDKSEPGPQWVVLKLTGSIGEGDFWNEIISHCNQNLIVIVSVEQLRRKEVRISHGLSWEATVEDLTSELQHNPVLKPLLKARHLIVTFRSDGAFWLDNHPDSTSSMLVFDAVRAEDEWVKSQGKGTVFGFLTCFTASIVRELCRQGNDPDFESGLIAGLAACRELMRLGHGRVIVHEGNSDKREEVVGNVTSGFPFKEITATILDPNEKFVSTLIPHMPVDRGNWMMLDEWQVHARSLSTTRPYHIGANAVAVLGPGALERFPVARFGALQTVDRNEIENLRTIRHLIHSYQNGGAQKKPLSLGVFGPAGAGKSFGVSQIAMDTLGLKAEDMITFNLSQFSNAADLNGAFHRVRDRVLTGQTPLVFWDEFDSQGYQWLQYLLAPMQDGAFQEGQVTHPIGKCVFVFAGATAPTFDTFGPCNPDFITVSEIITPGELHEVQNKWLDFVMKKGPDFKSRLSGYLNVLGPNPRQICIERNGQRSWSTDTKDLCFPIRRALLIRSQFNLKNDEQLAIDAGILRAMLEIPYYKSGARSLEFLCGYMRKMAKGSAPHRSHLPGQQLLDMHVDEKEFWAICERDIEFSSVAGQLAQGLHEDWLKGLDDNQRITNSNAKPWDELDQDVKDSNLAQATRIPTIVALAGLKVVRSKLMSETQEATIRQILLEHCEVLAEAEHNHWMLERMLAGWRYARIPEKDPVRKLHPFLIPYAQLSDVGRDKDRRVILGETANNEAPEIPDYIDRVKRVGYRIVEG